MGERLSVDQSISDSIVAACPLYYLRVPPDMDFDPIHINTRGFVGDLLT